MSKTDEIILSYNDSLIHRSDLKLLNESEWLNDRLIGFVYEYLEIEMYKNECSNQANLFSFVNPLTVQYLKLCSSLDEADACFLSPLELDKKRFIFFPINNNQSSQAAGGSHWSLLLFHRHLENSYFIHFDSMNGSNDNVAKVFYQKYKNYFKANKLELSNNFPKQQNSSDCGVYLLAATETIAGHIKSNQAACSNNKLTIDFSHLTPYLIKNTRKKYADLIVSLSKLNEQK